MLDWFADSTATSVPVSHLVMAIRLIAACMFGLLVAVSYRLHRYPTPVPATFPLTLVLLSILIAMVMQVIDDRVARAFSLVGALSIVRFRTVLDETQDIAFVIFAVVVGMAAGTGAIGVAAIGSAVMILTLCIARLPIFGGPKNVNSHDEHDGKLTLRTSIGNNHQLTVVPVLESNLISYRLISAETARGGSVLEWIYSVRFRPDTPVSTLLDRCSKVDGIQNVDIKINVGSAVLSRT